MGNISDVAQTSVQRVTASVNSQDFSIAAIAAYFSTSISTQRSLTFTSPDAFNQTFPASGATAGINKAGSAWFAQNPRPTSLKVLRLALPSTKTVEITPTAVNAKAYRVTVNGTEVVYTSDASATVPEITAGLTTLINALAISGVTATDNTTKLTIAGTAGTWFSVEITSGPDDGQMTIQWKTTDPGITTDLADIQTADKNWYAFGLLDWSPAIIDAASTWAESNAKFFLPLTQDSDCLGSGTTDILTTLKNGTRMQTLPFWHHDPAEFANMALLSRVLATTPGKRAFYHKVLQGISISALDDTSISNLKNKLGTYYVEFGGLNRTDGGKVSGGEWGDVIIGSDYYDSRATTLQASAILAEPDKVDGDKFGIAKLQNILQQVVKEMLTNKFGKLDFTAYPDLGYGLTVPAESDIDPTTRILSGLAAEVKLSGGIKKVSQTIRLVA